MGACQSTANNDVAAPHSEGGIRKEASKDVLTQKLSERSEGRAAAPEVTALKSTESAADSKSKAINSEDRKKDFKKGYSSGGSSLGLMRDENSSRSQLDVLHLSSMRDLAAENGLTQAVVRLETPFGKPIEEIYEGVHEGPFLGEGVSGVVRLVTHKMTSVQYACKVLDIGLISTADGLRQLRDEISIMCQLDHPNIVRIEEVYESTNTIYLLQELCLGGDLFDRLDEQPDIHYDEASCSRLVKQMVSSVRYLHSKGVVHRDLKLENFLFSTPDANSQLKMIDFGLSKHFDIGEVCHEQVGTPYTCAPEVLKGNYDEKSDIWSLGVITYLLLSGETPFGGCYENENMASVRQNILNGKFTFEPEDVWQGVSDLSKKFVRRLLNVDPTQRPTAREVQTDEWLQVYAKKDGRPSGKKLSPKIVGALVSFKEYSEMRRLLHEVLSFTLLPEQIEELREEFQTIDSDGDGEISLDAMKKVLMNTSAGTDALGGLTEAEVEDIFNALKVNKNDSTIRWHEFIAAGLSQCKVDDRNLQLAFDRLDGNRKGYISLSDLENLLGHSPETLESLKKIWKDSMLECSCKDDRISYDDFLFLMKGQSRRESKRPFVIWSPQAVAAMPSQLSKITDNDSRSSGEEAERDNKYFRKRSKSFDELSLGSFDSSQVERRLSYPQKVRPSIGGDDDLVKFVADQAKGPLIANREQYKKHRDLRTALLEASKVFDRKRQAHNAAMQGEEVIGSPHHGANLIMKFGSEAPSDLETAHQRALFNAAASRGGRHGAKKHAKAGHRRKRTQSDVTGMLLSPVEAAT